MRLDLRIDYDFETIVEFEILFLGEKKVIDFENKDVTFYFDSEGTYEISISQRRANDNFSRREKLLYILFFPIIGLFSLISLYGEETPLFERVNPYLISQTITVKLVSDTIIELLYTEPKYNKSQNTWSLPIISTSSTNSIETTSNCKVTENYQDFYDKYISFKWSYIAIALNIVAIFMIFSFMAFSSKQIYASIAFLAISVFYVMICILGLNYVKSKLLKMRDLFIKTGLNNRE